MTYRLLPIALPALLLLLLPSPARAAFLATCPTSPETGDRVYGIDTLSDPAASVECYATGSGNSLTGGASDTFLAANPDLEFLDYDGPPEEYDNFFFYTNLGTTTVDGTLYAYGTFHFGAGLTSELTELYLGFKVGNIDPTWAVFKITGFADDAPLSGYWYTTPVQGGGISHASIYGADVPPDVVPDPAVPEPTSMLLLGTGLAAAAAGARKRMRK